MLLVIMQLQLGIAIGDYAVCCTNTIENWELQFVNICTQPFFNTT